MAFGFLRRKKEQGGSKKVRGARRKQEQQTTKSKVDQAPPTTITTKTPTTTKKVSPSRQNGKDYSSPLVTITEDDIELQAAKTMGLTPDTPDSSIKRAAPHNVIDGGESGAEVVYDGPPVVVTVQESNADIKKKLFAPATASVEKKANWPTPERPTTAQVEERFAAARQLYTEESILTEESMLVEESVDEPFDEKEMKKEDPYIVEVMRANSIDEADKIGFAGPRTVRNTPTKKKKKKNAFGFDEGDRITEMANSIIESFNCGEGAFSFYDNMCAGEDSMPKKRPFFDEVFCMDFIKEAMESGFPMLYHQPPDNPVDADWTGQSMTMYIRPGDVNGQSVVQPILEWTTIDGGYSRIAGANALASIGMELLEIHSIMDTMDDPDTQENESMCFFSITTNDGGVHLFECTSENERDRVVDGIRNVIARMSYSLVVGDDVVIKELYDDDAEEADLPPLKPNAQSMTSISHAFLNAGVPQ